MNLVSLSKKIIDFLHFKPCSVVEAIIAHRLPPRVHTTPFQYGCEEESAEHKRNSFENPSQQAEKWIDRTIVVFQLLRSRASLVCEVS